MAKVKSWKVGSPGEPSFPSDYEIIKRAVLQVTEIKTNHNKYYSIELHGAEGRFRVYTHYGRTDDLETNPNAGCHETRYVATGHEADALYQSIYREKTNPRKGYKEVSLASAKIGSARARGMASGEIDAKTLEKTEAGTAAGAAPVKPVVKKSTLPVEIQDLVTYLYNEATNHLTSTVNVKITAKGIETPLGVLTIGQIEKGEVILADIWDLYKKGVRPNKAGYDQMVRLSGDFFTAIPHRLGRTRQAMEAAIIDTLEEFEEKQQTLQLMRDMLAVNGAEGAVLFNEEVDSQFKALGCELAVIDPKSGEFRELRDYVEKSQVKTSHLRVKSLFKVRRPAEWAAFDAAVGNERMLFHGSRIANWVGLLSRGILLPKIVVSMGVNRTDEGWLGHGIYFGDAACTSLYYTTPGRKKTRFMAIARVGLGKVKEYTKITYGLSAPPPGYDSCHGVRNKPGTVSQFADDEFVIYRAGQQRMEYLVEFTG
jgi:poly [ADP-ribose] polymerase